MSALVDTLLSALAGGAVATGGALVLEWRKRRAARADQRADQRAERADAVAVAEVTERHAVIKADIGVAPAMLKEFAAQFERRLEAVERAHRDCEERSDRADAERAELRDALARAVELHAAELEAEREKRRALERLLAAQHAELAELKQLLR